MLPVEPTNPECIIQYSGAAPLRRSIGPRSFFLVQGYLAHKKLRPPLGSPLGPRYRPAVGSSLSRGERGGGLNPEPQGSGFGVQGSGSRVQGSGFRVQGSGLKPARPHGPSGLTPMTMCSPRFCPPVIRSRLIPTPPCPPPAPPAPAMGQTAQV